MPDKSAGFFAGKSVGKHPTTAVVKTAVASDPKDASQNPHRIHLKRLQTAVAATAVFSDLKNANRSYTDST